MLAFAKTSATVTRYREKKLKQALMANYREDEITLIAIILEYVALDFFNRFMDVALAKWVRTTA